MDEMWQRHKSFILQVICGGVVFLVAFFVMRSMYGDQNDPERARFRNAQQLKDLEAKSSSGHAPSAKSIADQREIAARAEKTKWEFVRRVASVAGRDEKLKDSERQKAYVGESIKWTLDNIGRSGEAAAYSDYFAHVPQACLSKLRDAAKSALVTKAAQNGKEIDESLGLSSGYPEDEIPEALHGLAIVTEVVGRLLAKPGVDRVMSIRVSAQSQFPEVNDVHFVSSISVHFEVIGDPTDIFDVLRSFDSVGKPEQRMTVLESIDSIVPPSADEDAVKAVFNVVGLRLKAEKQAEGN